MKILSLVIYLALLLIVACVQAEAKKYYIPEDPKGQKPKGTTTISGGNRRLLDHVISTTADHVVKKGDHNDKNEKNAPYGTSGNPAAEVNLDISHRAFVDAIP